MKTVRFLLLSTLACVFNHPTQAATKPDFIELFKNYDACFLLYDLNEEKIISEYNPKNRCNQRISPDSTFKIALSLMGFNSAIINKHTEFKWNGTKYDLPDWNQNQTPESWLKYSVVWVSQQITHQLGMARIKHYLAGFDYGNQDFTGDPGKNNGLSHAWLSSSLKISAYEQLNFLKAMLTEELPLSPRAIAYTRANMYLGQLDSGAKYYGKTGSGRHGRNERLANPSRLRDGWFVGFIVSDGHQYVFVSNLTDKKPVPKGNSKPDDPILPYGSALLKPITLKILNQLFDTNAFA
ncbi:penicillin-binding transpeptidase domain-containing protein [Legionella waltersii]|uniref:Beta-lactamase n=1 Tax=Legionella waltersii TaxID=66969 RepID=A0A0W1ANH6_9GAMM|nr:penicillin-binding transpeptidase domain-containing protein [Legionella waltersii]KTD82881.1 class-D beta-lactamase [Legionella waltersii]SNV02050.1 class-D beta-lactamase [Legionella waltersii]